MAAECELIRAVLYYQQCTFFQYRKIPEVVYVFLVNFEVWTCSKKTGEISIAFHLFKKGLVTKSIISEKCWYCFQCALLFYSLFGCKHFSFTRLLGITQELCRSEARAWLKLHSSLLRACPHSQLRASPALFSSALFLKHWGELQLHTKLKSSNFLDQSVPCFVVMKQFDTFSNTNTPNSN